MTALGGSFGDTNTGRKRRRNEDTFVCEPDNHINGWSGETHRALLIAPAVRK